MVCAGIKPTEPAKPASCPLASQIGTVEVFTPLLSGAPAIEGAPGRALCGARDSDVLAGHLERQPDSRLPVAAKRPRHCDRARIYAGP
jgi:hypothetical protein